MQDYKNLLVVDMENIYLMDEDYMGLLDNSMWAYTQKQMKNNYHKIIKKIARLKENGWKIYFTGKTQPYYKLTPLIDEILPYWEENNLLIQEKFKNKKVALGGLFLERCVKANHELITGSYILKKLCISHGLVGDIPHFELENSKIY